MKVTIDKKSQNEGVITINLEEKDYKEAFENKLKEYGKKMNLKGFRPGKVPVGLVNKMYGKSIKADEINHKASNGLEDFIKDQKLQLLGDPIAIPNETPSDFETQKDFELKFDVGFVPEFNIPLEKKVKVNYYTVKEDKDLLEQTLQNLKDQFGDRTDPEIAEEQDTVFGDLKSEDGSIEKKAGIKIADMPKKNRNLLIGKKKGDVINFEIEKAFGKEKSGILGNMGMSKEELEALKGPFTLKVDSLTRMAPAEMNQEFFDKVFGPGSVKTEEEFISRVKEDIAKSNEVEQKNQFFRDIKKTLNENTKLELPRDFLKRWLTLGAGQENKIPEDQLEKELPDYIDQLKWNIITNKVREEQKIEVKPEEVKEETKRLFNSQLGQNFPEDQKDELLERFADNYLQENEGKNFSNIFNSLMERRILEYLEQNVTRVEKKINHKEFKKLLEG